MHNGFYIGIVLWSNLYLTNSCFPIDIGRNECFTHMITSDGSVTNGCNKFIAAFPHSSTIFSYHIHILRLFVM